MGYRIYSEVAMSSFLGDIMSTMNRSGRRRSCKRCCDVITPFDLSHRTVVLVHFFFLSFVFMILNLLIVIKYTNRVNTLLVSGTVKTDD